MLSAPPFQGQEFLAASFISRKICGRWWADFQLIVDLMAALSYVKEDQVLDYYDQVIEPLIQKLPNTIPEAALDYVDYFERTYVAVGLAEMVLDVVQSSSLISGQFSQI